MYIHTPAHSSLRSIITIKIFINIYQNTSKYIHLDAAASGISFLVAVLSKQQYKRVRVLEASITETW